MSDIEGDNNDNTLNGTSGSDSIKGKGGDDYIDGGSGDDVILGGDGNDTITGGAGQDTIIGGRGNDVMSAGNQSTTDTFVIRDGDGSDTITDFDVAAPDIIAFHMAEISDFQDVVDRMSTVGNDTIITFDNGDFLCLPYVVTADLCPPNFTYNSGPICMLKGTMIATPQGSRAIETLGVGDKVLTEANGAQSVCAIVKQSMHFAAGSEKDMPVLIKAGSLSDASPKQDLILSPQHRLPVTDPHNGGDVLVAATKLTGRRGIRHLKDMSHVTYYNILLDHHEIIVANGCRVESLLLTPYSARHLPAGVGRPAYMPQMAPAMSIVSTDPWPKAGRQTHASVVA
ncbi:MAG: Hint domain-containing protein [Aliishimia sp.]